MRARKLFLTSALCLVIGLAALWSKWNGNAGLNAGDSLDAWSVTFNGSVHGLPALIGIVSLLIAIISFVTALVRSLME